MNIIVEIIELIQTYICREKSKALIGLRFATRSFFACAFFYCVCEYNNLYSTYTPTPIGVPWIQISPAAPFRVVVRALTNFHLPIISCCFLKVCIFERGPPNSVRPLPMGAFMALFITPNNAGCTSTCM